DLYIVSTHEPRDGAEPTDELSDDELRASLRRVLGAEFPCAASFAARSIVANSRQAERYRSGRVVLAGDAAHVLSAGGSALNVGLLDAISL
ncbi:FAD-dependent monooxygenase, partial [Salmonella sp. SAL4432]|uniref:FAD-dependent monooxygenase n=1 Tax=Salmonella sp. SAL4432 TaxID=3159887 RepID=UPI003978E461